MRTSPPALASTTASLPPHPVVESPLPMLARSPPVPIPDARGFLSPNPRSREIQNEQVHLEGVKLANEANKFASLAKSLYYTENPEDKDKGKMPGPRKWTSEFKTLAWHLSPLSAVTFVGAVTRPYSGPAASKLQELYAPLALMHGVFWVFIRAYGGWERVRKMVPTYSDGDSWEDIIDRINRQSGALWAIQQLTPSGLLHRAFVQESKLEEDELAQHPIACWHSIIKAIFDQPLAMVEVDRCREALFKVLANNVPLLAYLSDFKAQIKEREPITEVSQLTDILYGYASEGPAPHIATLDSRLMTRAYASRDVPASRGRTKAVTAVALPATSGTESDSPPVQNSSDSEEEEPETQEVNAFSARPQFGKKPSGSKSNSFRKKKNFKGNSQASSYRRAEEKHGSNKKA